MYIEEMDGWIGKGSRWKGKGKVKGGEMKVTLKKRKKKGRQEKEGKNPKGG